MPRSTRELERELKFETPLNAMLPDLRDLVGRTERLAQRRFSSVYFDTAEKRLWERGMTLRCRLEQGKSDGIWTLKLPSAIRDSVRERTEVSWPGGPDAIPEGALEVTRGVVRHEPLREMVELETLRQRMLLHGDGDRALGEIDDDVVSIRNGPREGDRFRQVEFELMADEGGVARQVADRFEAARLAAGAPPKVAVALGLQEAGGGSALTLDRRSSLVDVVQVAVSAGLEQLLSHDWRLRFTAPDMGREDVHKARVAVRRLRSNLRTLEDLLDPVWTRHVREDLKWIGAALGDVRDADVLAGLVVTAPDELQVRLSGQRAAAVDRLTSALATERYINLLDHLHAASRNPVVRSASAVDRPDTAKAELQDLVGAEWRAVRRRVKKSGEEPSDHQLHRIRIATKRLRYAAELAEPVIGKRGKRVAKAAEAVQTELGDHHDAVEAEKWLRAQVFDSSREAPEAISVETSFGAGCLVAAEQEKQRELRGSWQQGWKALRRQANADVA